MSQKTEISHVPSVVLHPDQVNDYVEAFEQFCRNPVTPIAEELAYDFDTLQPPYLLPDQVLASRQGDPIEGVSVHVGRRAAERPALSVAFEQESGDSLVVARTPQAAQQGGSFVLKRTHANRSRDDEFLDTVSPASVGRFLVGLSIGHQNRQHLAIEEREGTANAYVDPQSTAFFNLIMMGLEKRATYSEIAKKYLLALPMEAGSQMVDIETILTSAGRCEYELSIHRTDRDGENERLFAMSLAIAHQYGHQTDCQADISGGTTVMNDFETLSSPVPAEALSAYGLATLKAVTPQEVAVESLRKFWQ